MLKLKKFILKIFNFIIHKNATNIYDADTEHIVASKKSNCRSIKSFEKVKFMPFILKEIHRDILKKSNEILNKVKDLIRKDFDIEAINND